MLMCKHVDVEGVGLAGCCVQALALGLVGLAE